MLHFFRTILDDLKMHGFIIVCVAGTKLLCWGGERMPETLRCVKVLLGGCLVCFWRGVRVVLIHV